MKKSKIFMVTSTLVLAVAAIFATKANKKFNSVTTALFASGSGTDVHATNTYNVILTTQGTVRLYARIISHGGSAVGTVSDMKTVTTGHNVFYH